jgi:hypothetical protein
MICSRCRKTYEASELRCPRCGKPNPSPDHGVFQTSTVMISAGGADVVYRSVDEVPARLRSKLLKSTNSVNSATILIADRRGRKQIARAMRSLPSPIQRRLRKSVIGSETHSPALEWLTPARKQAILGIVLILALAVIVLVFAHHWQ